MIIDKKCEAYKPEYEKGEDKFSSNCKCGELFIKGYKNPFKVYTKEGVYNTALFIIADEKKNCLDGYCVDISVALDPSKRYHYASPEEVCEIFNPCKLAIVRKIVNSSYPAICDLKYLAKAACIECLTAEEAVAATQAAIWNAVNSCIKLDCKRNNRNVIKLYEYLVNLCDKGMNSKEICKGCDKVKFSLDTKCMKITEKCGKKVFAPVKICSDSPNVCDIEVCLHSKDKNVCFTDMNDKPIKKN